MKSNKAKWTMTIIHLTGIKRIFSMFIWKNISMVDRLS